MKPRAGSKALIREINEALVLDVVRAHGPVARAAIAAGTGLSPATVTGIAAKLLHDGLLVETPAARGSTGRPARLLELRRDAVLAAGVRLTPTDAYATVVNLRGEVVAERREPAASADPDDVCAAVGRAVRAASAGHRDAALVGVGVAVSGVVDQPGGVVRHSGSLGWADVALRGRLAAEVRAPVAIDSDVNSVASGLLLFEGRLAGRDLLVFSIGASLGASVVVRGRIHRGFAGAAGGFAHWRVESGADRACHCGARDCLEAWSSRWGVDRAQAGGAADDEAVAAAAAKLGAAVANAAKLFGPERVVLAAAHGIPGFADRTEQVFLSHYEHGDARAPEVEHVAADDLTIARGAACTILARLFTTDLSDAAATAGDDLESIG